jgi:hypothetical protein
MKKPARGDAGAGVLFSSFFLQAQFLAARKFSFACRQLTTLQNAVT